jgi:hypothetical protein
VVGQTISHYRVLEKLGSGGMGIVYRAEDLKLKRQVALKFMPEEFAGNRVALERFRREAEAASALNHPSICVVHDIDEAAGRPFIAMEYVAGRTLDQLIGAKGVGLSAALRYAIQIADALAKAHAAGRPAPRGPLTAGNSTTSATATATPASGRSGWTRERSSRTARPTPSTTCTGPRLLRRCSARSCSLPRLATGSSCPGGP